MNLISLAIHIENPFNQSKQIGLKLRLTGKIKGNPLKNLDTRVLRVKHLQHHETPNRNNFIRDTRPHQICIRFPYLKQI